MVRVPKDHRGLAGLTKTVALELAEHGVAANAICPGHVLTPLVQKQIPEQARARGASEEAVMKDVLLAAQPTKQFVEVSQIATLTTSLAPTMQPRSPASCCRSTAAGPRTDKTLIKAIMQKEDILKLPSMPASGPSYPAGPYRFIHRECMVITYETNLEIIRHQLPVPFLSLRPCRSACSRPICSH